MDIRICLLLAAEAGLALVLLWRTGVLPKPAHVLCAALLLTAAFVLRGACLNYVTDDYRNFLSAWVDFFRTHGGLAALRAPVGNYNVPYLTVLALISGSTLPDLHLIKLFSILFDVLLAWSVMQLVGLFRRSAAWKLAAFFLVLFWPTVVLNGALWGQCDSVYAALAVLSVYLVLSGHPLLGVVSIGASFAFKLQAVFVMPVFLLFWLTRRVKLRHALAFPAVCVVMVLPAVIAGRGLWDALTIPFQQTGSIGTGLNYNSPSVFALFGDVANPDAAARLGIGAAALVVLWFSIKMLTRRITQLADGVRTVQRGDYSFRLTLAGDDELTELGREFNNLTERLETTEAQRRRFVSDASHELKTPLASIRLLSDSISQSADMDSETMREFVTDIGSEAERLQRTTEKLLDLSRRDDGVQSDVTVVDLQQAVHGTLHLLRPLAAKSDVTLTCLMSDGVTVRASEDDIYHIVFNLVENAIKYNLPGGSVTVRVEARGEQSILSVADTGIGIPEADRPNIFNRFYRVDKARSREHGGSGLGLSIVHDAAALYGGTVTVDGVEPHGTRFTVTFPRTKADNAPEVQKEVPET